MANWLDSYSYTATTGNPPFPVRTNTLEAVAGLDAWELRTISNQVNEAPKPIDEFELCDGYTYKMENNYQGNVTIRTFTIKKEGRWRASFQEMQYPACCGISILSNFCSESLDQHFEAALRLFFIKTGSRWKPNIQYVAVKECEYEEKYNEDDDEYYDEIVGMSDDYVYNEFILTLNRVLQPTLISSFINKNSDNQCDVYQAVNINRS